MCQRLQSFYSGSRKEAAYTLGRLGDPRAVPSLVHVLKYDNFKDVRVAAAIALGEIGGSEAAVALERTSIYDHREDVRKAATTALERLNTKAQALAAQMQQQGGTMSPGPGQMAGSRPPAPQPPATGQPSLAADLDALALPRSHARREFGRRRPRSGATARRPQPAAAALAGHLGTRCRPQSLTTTRAGGPVRTSEGPPPGNPA